MRAPIGTSHANLVEREKGEGGGRITGRRRRSGRFLGAAQTALTGPGDFCTDGEDIGGANLVRFCVRRRAGRQQLPWGGYSSLGSSWHG